MNATIGVDFKVKPYKLDGEDIKLTIVCVAATSSLFLEI